MKMLKVKMPFRDINDFSVRHEVGDVFPVSDPERAARLVEAGLCEEVAKEKTIIHETAPTPAAEPAPAPVQDAEPESAASDAATDTDKEEDGPQAPESADSEPAEGAQEEEETPAEEAKEAPKRGRKSTKK